LPPPPLLLPPPRDAPPAAAAAALLCSLSCRPRTPLPPPPLLLPPPLLPPSQPSLPANRRLNCPAVLLEGVTLTLPLLLTLRV
jgi:hypothetical protein